MGLGQPTLLCCGPITPTLVVVGGKRVLRVWKGGVGRGVGRDDGEGGVGGRVGVTEQVPHHGRSVGRGMTLVSFAVAVGLLERNYTDIKVGRSCY